MMTSLRIMNYVSAEPFRPFRINMTSGKAYDIRHPEMVSVGRTTVRVYMHLCDEDDEPQDREQELSIILIESIEPLDAAVAK